MSLDCIHCEKSIAVYCGKCVDAEREELNRLRRLTPTGAYTLNIAHEEELERMREALRAAEKRELEALAELDEARDLLQAVATACRGLGPRTDAVMSVVGNALAELDEERANVEMLKTHVETLREAWQGASEAVTKLGEQLNASEADCERFCKLLDDCRDELMGHYDPDSVNSMIHRIDAAIGPCDFSTQENPTP